MLATLAAALALAAPAATPADVYVLAGQSNMVGYAMNYAAEKPDPRIRLAVGARTIPARTPLVADAGYGPGIPFAKAALRPGRQVVLVMCAESGSPLALWQPGARLFDACVQKVRALRLPVRGVLFFQGESDTKTDEDAAAWAARFAVFVNAFRAKVGNVPLVFAQIVSWPATWLPGESTPERWQQVRDQQAAVTLPRARMIRTDDLPYGDDPGAHFSARSYTVIGRRFAAALRRLLCVK